MKNQLYKVVFSILIATMFSVSKVNASCLGLSVPTPKTTNVCEVLVERLVIPKTEVFCDLPWYARIGLPHCNLPGACHVDPSCKSFEVAREIGSLILNAGDLYCDIREISPEKMIEDIGNQAYSDLIKLTTGGTSSILFDVANRHIDIMSCSGSGLNKKLKSLIKCTVSQSSISKNESFYPIDINNVRIISSANSTASIYLREGFDAITLNDLVIINDNDFQILKNWNKNPGDSLSLDERRAVTLMIHELVHVRQYRNMGKEVFINRYLTEALVNGYADISMEQEARRFGNWSNGILRTPSSCALEACKSYIQGNITWDKENRRKNWHERNLNRLCSGTNSKYSPGNCFSYVIRDGDKWGKKATDIVNWSKAIDICAGTSSARDTTSCLKNSISEGLSFNNAIDQCKGRF